MEGVWPLLRRMTANYQENNVNDSAQVFKIHAPTILFTFCSSFQGYDFLITFIQKKEETELIICGLNPDMPDISDILKDISYQRRIFQNYRLFWLCDLSVMTIFIAGNRIFEYSLGKSWRPRGRVWGITFGILFKKYMFF